MALLLNGALLGPSDDEAYYWVVSLHPPLSFAYHPPMVAWVIAAARWAFGWALSGTALLRLPAAACVAAVVALALRWLEDAGAKSFGILALFSFAGFFALSWMIVPDTPLFLGWMLAFVGSWRLCRGSGRATDFLMLGAGVAVATLSKYSGVLVPISALGCVLLWAPKRTRWKAVGAVVLAGLLASIPILLWNARHEWASLLYQVQDRHEGAKLSLSRYLRFLAVEIVAAGPLLTLGAPRLAAAAARGRGERGFVFRFALAWAAPAAVFCIQPLFSDFKVHWAFVAWWPVALAYSWEWGHGETVPTWLRRARVVQCAYGFTLIALVVAACHFPLLAPFTRDPRMDVTNDLYGWSGLRAMIVEKGGAEAASWPVVGSRYQTASQAFFALGARSLVTLLPRDLKARDEWPMIEAVDGYGPEWPTLRAPVLFVSDIRYDSAPEFRGASCTSLGRGATARGGHAAKWIELWKCVPAGSSGPA